MTEVLDQWKQAACERVDQLAPLLLAASHSIHEHPELNFEEHHAHSVLTDLLATEGLEPERHAWGLETAFDCRVGDGGAEVAVLCEYDALPGLGHACGHNIIATAGLGAGLAAAAVARQVGGRLRIMGTPAEEGGGGKVKMARAGAFVGIDAAMMVHPADADLLQMDCIAVQQCVVRYHGRAAHAAAAPWDGQNALDAAVLGYMNVAALRQHIRPTERIHGVFTKGGEKPNIVPAATEQHWFIRSHTIESLQPLKERVIAALAAGAAATGCTFDYEWVDETFADMIDNRALVAAYVENAARVGRTVRTPDDAQHHVVGSTDMGNVSYLVPSIHPMIQVAPAGTPIHSVAFAEWAASAEGDRAVIDGAKVMAMTIIDLWSRPELLAAVRREFDTRPRGVPVF
jgi:amidohydrolase